MVDYNEFDTSRSLVNVDDDTLEPECMSPMGPGEVQLDVSNGML